MQYLIYYSIPGAVENPTPFFTNWFEPDNHFNPDAGMVVFDLINNLYFDNELEWKEIESDHL